MAITMYIRIICACLMLASLSGLVAAPDETILRNVRAGKPDALVAVDAATLQRLHNHGGRHYYIAREIGQGALRSLLGCFKNPDATCRKLCADNLYQLQLTYVHRKALLHYFSAEKNLPVRLALQDLLVRINENRFAQARSAGDADFLAKIEYSEIADFAEKGYPSGERYTERDFRFLAGGMRNKDTAMQVYAARMLGRIQGRTQSIQRFLTDALKTAKNTAVIQAINEALGCLRNPSSCPDVER